jgi:hypothetical protein
LGARSENFVLQNFRFARAREAKIFARAGRPSSGQWKVFVQQKLPFGAARAAPTPALRGWAPRGGRLRGKKARRALFSRGGARNVKLVAPGAVGKLGP